MPLVDFQAVFEAQADPVVLVSGADLILEACSLAYLRAAGANSQVVSRPMLATSPWCEQSEAAATLLRICDAARLSSGGYAVPLPELHIPGTGACWNEVLATPVLLPGSDALMRLVFRHRQDAAVLRARVLDWQKLFDHASSALITLSDGQGTLHYVSPSVETILGYEPHEYLARPGRSWVHPDDLQSLGAASKVLYQDGGTLRTRIRMRHRDGGYRLMDVVIRNLLSDPEIQSVVTHAYDVSSYVELQTEVERANEFLQQALSAANAICWEWDLSQSHEQFMREPSAFFGLDSGSVEADANVSMGSLANRDALRARVASLPVGETFSHAFEIKVGDGEPRFYEMRGKLLRTAADGSGLLSGVTLDVTAQERLKLHHEQIERRMQESQKLESLGVLAGGVAHDFNNILMAILGNASLAKLQAEEYPGILQHLAAVEDGVSRASDLCRQMLAYAGKGRFVIAPVDLNALVDDTVHLLRVSISKKAVLRLNLFPEVRSVMGDATQLRQVLMNLVINASDAIGERSGVISISTGMVRTDRDYLEVSLLAGDLPEGLYVTLEVSDTGAGMSKEEQARMFEPFFTTKATGRGLGLAAVLGIVRGHQGAARVYSEPGVGTSFKLLFPAYQATADDQAVSPAPLGWAHRDGTVLVVDDEETVRGVAGDMLVKLGFRVLLARDGLHALELFRARRAEIVCVLLDLTMPELDGEETFRELRRIQPEVRVLLMSGYNEQDALARFVGKGLAGFIQKPFDVQTLQTRVFALLEGSKGHSHH